MRLFFIRTMFIALLAVACGATTQNAPGNENRNVSMKDAVSNALHQAGYKDLSVDEDRDKRLLTLHGNLADDAEVSRAGQLAAGAAPGWAISNQIGIRPKGAEHQAAAVTSNIDTAIEHTYKATLISNQMDKAGIHFASNNGVLTLTGTVDTPQDRARAEELARTIPNIREVVNKLDVKR